MMSKHFLIKNLLTAFFLLVFLSCEKDSTSSKIGPLHLIEVTPTALNIEIDSTYQFSAIGRDADMNVITDLTFTWASRYSNVGTVDENGLFTALSSGTTFLTAKSGTIKSAQVAVSVYDPVFSIEILQDSLTLHIDSTAQFTAVGKDMNGDDITGLYFIWESENTNIATIDNDGVVTGVAVGNTNVIAKLREVESLPAVVVVKGTVTDIDGNVYNTVTIGVQVWMAENLKVTHYRNGDAIPNVTDNGQWSDLSTGVYCNYDNNESNVATYGRLYNWYAVEDSRNIAPEGWHVPSDTEWQTLVDYLGGASVAGVKMKETGTIHWNSPNTGATNESGFSALPGGYGFPGTYHGMGSDANFWSSTEYVSGSAWHRGLDYDSSEVDRDTRNKGCVYSVRCVRD